MKNVLGIILILGLISCQKNSSITETSNNNPSIDSTNIAFRVADIYWNDTSLKQEVEFHFKYDTSYLKRWNRIQIDYKLNVGTFTSYYNAEFKDGLLTKLTEPQNDFNIIELYYSQLPPYNSKQLSYIKFRRDFSPFELKFEYDSSRLIKITKYELNQAGIEQQILESKKVCIEVNYKVCDTANVDIAYQRDFRLNSFFLCKELAPVFLLLAKPYQTKLDDILPDLPLIFSKYLPASKMKPKFGTYELGLNTGKEPNFVYFRPLRARYPEGYNFVYKK